jgi:FG-GAP-like repeat/Astacin (Peptidase family M12A)
MTHYSKPIARRRLGRSVRFTSSLVLGVASVAVACSGTNPDSESVEVVASSSEPLYVLSTAIWPTNNVSVCWETGGSATEKGWVQSAIAGTWQQSSAVTFTDWGPCTGWPSPSANIRIRISDEGPHTSGLGTQLNGATSGMTLNFTFANWGPTCQSMRESCIRNIAVHEFGHALGFAHEQNRADTPNTCKPCASNVECATGQVCQTGHCAQGGNGNTQVGNWDQMSTMNYCNPQWNNAGGLSETDKFGLQNYYGRPNYFVDVNADGKADAIVVNPNGIFVKLSDNSNGFGPTQQWTSVGFVGSRGTYFADVTGDGQADAIAVNDYGVTVRRSTGSSVSGFSANEDWTGGPYYGEWGTFFADVTGDGRADAIVVNSTGITVRVSNGLSFGANETWLVGAIPSVLNILFGKVSGNDSRADLVLVTESRIQVRASSGTSFGAAADFTSGPYFGTRGTFLADVSGDGKDDAIVVNDSSITVRRSTGSAFSANETWSSFPYFGSHGTYFADSAPLAGFPAADALVVNDNGIFLRRSTGGEFRSKIETWSESFFGQR